MSARPADPYRTPAPKPVPFEGRYVLRPSRFARGFSAALLIGATVAAFVHVFGTRGEDGDAVMSSALFWYGFLILIATALTLWTSLVHAYVDANGIAGQVRFRRAQIAWDDVFSISLGQYDLFSIRASNGVVLSLSRRWTNIDAFARAVSACVEPDKLWDARTRRAIAVLAGRSPNRREHGPTIARRPEGEPEEVSAAIARWKENPFFVLGVPPDCSRAEAERAGEKMLALLAVGASAAKTYATPVGPGDRTPDKVRAALAEVREPTKRIVHEVWARVPAGEAAPGDGESPLRPWKGAMRAVGWRNA